MAHRSRLDHWLLLCSLYQHVRSSLALAVCPAVFSVRRLDSISSKEQRRSNAIVNKDYEQMGGSKSFGEFGSMLREIFEPSTEARFEWDHWGTLRGKPVMAFAYHVSQSRSQYRLVVEDAKLSIITAYRGLVEVDPDTHVVMRVSTIAENIPPDFPIRKAEDVLDYDYQEHLGAYFSVAAEIAGPDERRRRSDKTRRGVPPVPQVLGGSRYHVRHRSAAAAAGRQDQRDPRNAAEAQQKVACLSSSFRTCCGYCKR